MELWRIEWRKVRGTGAEIGRGDAGSREGDGLGLEEWRSVMLEVETGMVC